MQKPLVLFSGHMGTCTSLDLLGNIMGQLIAAKKTEEALDIDSLANHILYMGLVSRCIQLVGVPIKLHVSHAITLYQIWCSVRTG